MTLEELNQLYYLKREIEMDTRRLQALNAETGPAAIRTVISDIRATIETKQQRCIETKDTLERYIAGISDDFTRQIFTSRFVQGMSWEQVADCAGGWNSASNVRQIARRYIEKHPAFLGNS